MRRVFVSVVLVAASVLVLPDRATAASIVIDGTGVLVGATGVDVNGTLYTVAFVDGSCAQLFSGCDSTSDFDFSTQADALAAALALQNQVFGSGDIYDQVPALTQGCQGTTAFCQTRIPYSFAAGLYDAAFVTNQPNVVADGTGIQAGGSPAQSFVDSNRTNMARFTAVPEPATLLLVGTGAFGALANRRRLRR